MRLLSHLFVLLVVLIHGWFMVLEMVLWNHPVGQRIFDMTPEFSASSAVLAANQSGEIYVRGEQVSGEYTSKKVIGDDGWFGTNDGGYLDEEGYLFVEGRLDDVIVRGGENMSPGEIEDVLREHPAVADVAVLGLPDNEWGEKVCAVVVAKDARPSPDELAAWARARRTRC